MKQLPLRPLAYVLIWLLLLALVGQGSAWNPFVLAFWAVVWAVLVVGCDRLMYWIVGRR
jgi:hypothetical protein